MRHVRFIVQLTIPAESLTYLIEKYNPTIANVVSTYDIIDKHLQFLLLEEYGCDIKSSISEYSIFPSDVVQEIDEVVHNLILNELYAIYTHARDITIESFCLTPTYDLYVTAVENESVDQTLKNMEEMESGQENITTTYLDKELHRAGVL